MNLAVALLLGSAMALLPGVGPAVPRRRREFSVPVGPILIGCALFALIGGAWGIGAGIIATTVAARRNGQRRIEEDRTWGGAAPVVVELVAAAVRAGTPPTVAVRAAADAVGPVHGAGLRHVAERWRYGLGSADADLDLPSRLVAQSLERAHDSGAAPAVALEHVAAELAADAATARQEQARRVGVKAALPLGVCLLPAFLCLGVAPLVASLVAGMSR